jgi:hypothetical protein
MDGTPEPIITDVVERMGNTCGGKRWMTSLAGRVMVCQRGSLLAGRAAHRALMVVDAVAPQDTQRLPDVGLPAQAAGHRI